MKSKTFISILICWSFFYVYTYSSNYTYTYEFITGYSFLFSRGDSPYYRSHTDLSEGFFGDEFNFKIIPKNEKGWFDIMQVQASLSNRLDSSKSISIILKKHKLYTLKINYDYFYDFFYDTKYNYGADNRNLERSNFDIDFKWKGIKHFVFDTGYKYIISKGDINVPSNDWGEIFSIPLNRHVTREEYSAGGKYYKGGFSIDFNQEWVDVTDDSRYMNGDVYGVGFGSQVIISTNRNRSGSVDSSIPISTLIINYSADRWSTGSSFSYKNGSIDEDTLNFKEFLFYDFNSKNSFLIKAIGGSNTPEYNAKYNIDFDLSDNVTLEYNVEWDKLETASNLMIDRNLTLYPTQGNPIVIGGSDYDGYYYKNAYTTNSISAITYPIKNLIFTTSYTHTSGDITQRYLHNSELSSNIYESYSFDTLKFDAHYRTIFMTKLRGGYSYENIDNPLYRTAGDHKNEFYFSASQPIRGKFSIDVSYHDSRLKDSSIKLDSSVKLFETSADYTLNKNFNAGFGFTHLDLDHFENFIYFNNGNKVSSLELYDTSQNGYFAYSTFKDKKNRLKGQIKVYYLDDNGKSLPLSRWNASGKFEIKLRKYLWAQVEGRYYDYNEDIFPIHNYSIKQVIFGLRWKY